MKQKFKGKELTEKRVINSIIRFFNKANVDEIREGLNWYNDANDHCKQLVSRFNLPLQVVVGIVAAFSPQTDWLSNKRYALSFLINPTARYKSLAQDTKARTIAKLNNERDIYNALSVADKAYKTKAFFLNILNPDIVTSVTIDRHAIAVCIQSTDKVEALSDDYGKLTKAQYEFFERCYAKAALKLDILPQQLQAITWTVYRRLRELRQHTPATAWQPFVTDEETPF